MGLPLSLAPLLGKAISGADARKSCLFLGDQQISATEAEVRAAYGSIIPETPPHAFEEGFKLSLTPRYRDQKMVSCVYFANLIGFEVADVVDIDERGFVNIRHDLNEPGLETAAGHRYDVIFDGGTLEHIFSTAGALRNIGECTNVGGVVIHLIPMNNFINHGFYQISPTLFFDYYGWNKWEVLMAFYLTEVDNQLHVYKANAREFAGAALEFADKPHSVFFAVRRTAQSSIGVVPTQGMYATRMALPKEYVRLR